MLQSVLTAFWTVLFMVLVLYLFPWNLIKIGSNPLFPKDTITVSGEAQGKQASQIALYYASVNASNDDKQTALNEVNTKMTALIAEVKKLGVPDEDIQTQNVGVNEYPPSYPVPVDTTVKRWTANNSITITLRDLTKASNLADILTIMGTNVSGPNYQADNTTSTQADVLGEAIENARKKAEKIAQASGRTLGKAIKIDEGGYGVYPVMERSMGVGGDTKVLPPPTEPGSQTVYKTVTVTFELR